MKLLIQKILNACGYQMLRYPGIPADIQRRMKLLNHFKINKILDVGANKGQYAKAMRGFGFSGTIISFEPMKEAYAALAEASSADQEWKAENFALGNEETEASINIAGNSISSSILDMLPAHLQSAPHSAYVGKEIITVKKLDSVFPGYYTAGDSILLKIDTQGFEKNVLDGAEQALRKIKGIQLEMSLVPLYNSPVLIQDMICFLADRSFQLYSLENGFFDVSNGRLLQADGIFYKN